MRRRDTSEPSRRGEGGSEGEGSGISRVGVGRSVLTPHQPGPTAGWGFLGRRDAAPPLGPDQQNYATALVLEDGNERVVLVNTDLHCGSVHLWRAAAEAGGVGVDRVVVAGSHTHAGPAQRYGNHLYSLFASASVGQLRAMTAHLCDMVAEAVTEAVASLTPGAVGVAQGPVVGVTSNRAVPAWRHYDDDTRQRFATEGPGRLIPADLPLADRLVDPRVTVLVARAANGTMTGALAWFAVHGTSLGPRWPTFGADLWGVARSRVEAELPGVMVGFAGGASGDITPLPVDEDGELRTGDTGERPTDQGEALAQAVGSRIGETVAGLVARAEVGPVSLAAGHEWWNPRRSGLPQPLFGMATLGAGVDGPTERRDEVKAGVQAPAYLEATGRGATSPADQEPKVSIAAAVTRLPVPLGPLVGLVGPRHLPLHVIRIGDHVLATVPGEPTTMAGWRIEQAVQAATGAASASVIGFAGDYAGYWATAEEYQEQRYEGSSTLFGPRALQVLIERLEYLAANL